MHGHLGIKRHILFTGATGYIGGSVLARLLSHPQSDSFRITILVRDAQKAAQFRSMGIHSVVGTYSDLQLLENLAADANLVVACADADDEDAARAILRGLKQRYDKTGEASTLIHTSGTGILIDNAQGMYVSDSIYSDLDIKQLESLPITQPHRVVDVALVDADKQGYVKTYIILPGTIYGIATGSLVDAGLQNAHSQQIPRLVRLSLDRGRAGMVGEGKNIWPNVHIQDVTDLYILIVDSVVPHRSHSHGHSEKLVAPPPLEHGAAGFYFAENGEHTLYSVGEAIGKVMVSLKKCKEYTPTPFTEEETRKYFPDGTSLGTNSRCRADRAKAIGWKPRKTTKDMLASIKQEFKH
ncbi:NAD(P)-binding protein [Agrocybe pediades]|nr:NAD(P)-binding protein [Agrocybe pediades]